MSWPAYVLSQCKDLEKVAISPDFKITTQMGGTDYLDRFKVTDLKDNKIVTGVDQYQRPFIAVRVQVEYKSTQNKYPCVLVIFQRYTGRPDFWTHCNNQADYLFYNCSNGGTSMGQEKWQCLNQLITMGVVENDFCKVETV